MRYLLFLVLLTSSLNAVMPSRILGVNHKGFNGQRTYASLPPKKYSMPSEKEVSEPLLRTFALQAEAAIFIKDRANPAKFFLTLQNVNPDVIFYASRTIAGRATLKAFLQDDNLSEKSNIISSFSSKIQQQAFEESGNITLALSNIKWNPDSKTITMEVTASQSDQLQEGTYLKPLFFIRLKQ